MATLLALALALTPVASAHHGPPYDNGSEHDFGEMVDYSLVFPVDLDIDFSDWFYAPRCCDPGEVHHAIDLMAPKMTPVLAAASGTIKYVNWSRDTGQGPPDPSCCTLAIDHDDGWESWYIHLNNDTPGTDDGQGWGIAPGIEPDVHVVAGQLIGWVGDSGNAEGTSPHLHYELRDPENIIVNPYQALLQAASDPFGSCTTAGSSGENFPNGARTGLVDPVSGVWCLESASGTVAFYFGNPGDYPFMGDWDCDGVDTPGLYRQSDGYVYLRNSNNQGNADIKYFFGNPGDIPLAGDFDGDGCDTVSLYRPATTTFYVINTLGSDDQGLGAADTSYIFGNPGDKPFAGDFDADGTDTYGLHRESTGLMYFRNTHTQGPADHQFIYGNPGDRIVAGDWNNNNTDTPGLYRPGVRKFYLRYTNSEGAADATISFGEPTWLPIAGRFFQP
jgi:murein DD-endopeptidase MepM/ murein hydrolase activator NlpD